MQRRKVYLEHNKTLSDSATVTVDIDIITPISRLAIDIEAEPDGTPSATTVRDIASQVSKIELLDGSRVLASMSMKEWQALNFFEMGRYPFQDIHMVDGETIEERCYINFGRYLGDIEYLFDPMKYKNPQLKITYALTVGANDFSEGSGRLTVAAHTMDNFSGVINGFLMAKRQFTKTLASSGHEVIDLPCDYPYRLLMLCAPKVAVGVQETFSSVKLSADADKIVMIDEDTADILEANKSDYGQGNQIVERISAASGYFDADFWELMQVGCLEEASGHFAFVYAVDQNRATIYDNTLNTTAAVSGALDTLAKITFQGYSPYGSVLVSLGDLNDEKDFIPAQSFGSLKLDLTLAAANAVYVVSQQLVRD